MSRRSTIDTYLARVERRLPGSAAIRGDVIDELRDGLLEAVERHRQTTTADPALAATAEFGPPETVSSGLAVEIRLRLVRRAAARSVLVLASLGLGWWLYEALVGFEPATVPDGWAQPLFLVSVDLLQFVPGVAVLGTFVLVLASSRRWWSWMSPRLLGWLARLVLVAIVVSLAALGVAGLTADASYHRIAVGAGILTVGSLLTALVSVSRAIQHLRHCAGA
jgi:hypothetical protein